MTITQPDAEPAWLQWHDSLRRWSPTLVASWLIGVVLLSIRLAATWRGVQRLLKENAKPISGPLREAADRICRCLRVPTVRLLESVELQVPIAVGWLRPVVLIPASVIVGLPPAQVEALLAHELAHLCRRDYLVNLVQSVVEILFFYHPAVWWLSRTIRCEREQACDDLTVSVVQDSVVYARALTRLASNHIEHPRTAVAASGGHLFRRIERLVSPTTARSPHAPNSAWVVCLLIAGLAIAVAGTPGLIAQMQARSTTKEHTSDEARPAEQASDSRRSSQPNAAVLFGTTSPGADWIETPVVEGTVVDVDGRPVDSADVFLRLRSGATDGTTEEPVFSAPVAKVATVGGRFHFPATRVPNPEKRFGSPYGFDVIAAHKGNAIGWWHILDPGPIEIKLRPEFVLQGRVASGSDPVAQASVSVVRVVTKGELAWKAADSSYRVGTSDAGTIELGGALSALTNANGEFQIAGLPSEAGVVLQIEHPGFVRQRAYAVTTDLDPTALRADLDERVHPQHKPQPTWQANRAHNEVWPNEIETNPVTVKLRRGIDVEIHVVDEQTGNPIPNVELPAYPWRWGPTSMQFTDARGIARYENFTPGRISIQVGAPAKSAYLGVTQSLELNNEPRNRIVTVGLPKGIAVSGSVVDRRTKQGVGGATIYFVADTKKRQVRPSLPASQNVTNSVVVGISQKAVVGANGQFRLAIPSVPGQLILWGSVPGYRTFFESGSVVDVPAEFHKAINAEPGRPIENVVFELDRAPTLRWHVVDPDGKPAAGVEVKATLTWRDADLRGTSTRTLNAVSDKDGHVELNGIFTPTKAPTSVEIVFEHRTRRLGAQLALHSPLDAESTTKDIRLERLGRVTMRLVDRATKKGIPNVRIDVYRRASDPFARTSRAIDEALFTDADGTFVFDRVLPGVEHSLAVIQLSPSNPPSPNQKPHNLGPVLAAFVVAPGTSRDLGIVETSPAP